MPLPFGPAPQSVTSVPDTHVYSVVRHPLSTPYFRTEPATLSQNTEFSLWFPHPPHRFLPKPSSSFSGGCALRVEGGLRPLRQVRGTGAPGAVSWPQRIDMTRPSNLLVFLFWCISSSHGTHCFGPAVAFEVLVLVKFSHGTKGLIFLGWFLQPTEVLLPASGPGALCGTGAEGAAIAIESKEQLLNSAKLVGAYAAYALFCVVAGTTRV